MFSSGCKPSNPSTKTSQYVGATQLEISLEPGQAEAKLEIPMKNPSSQVMKVIGVQSDCGCVMSHEAGRMVAAGESVLLEATFSPTPAMGDTTVKKQIRVQVDGLAEPIVLQLVAKVAQTRRLSSDKLEWKGSALAAQVLKLESPLAFELKEVRGSNSSFQWEVLERANAQELSVKVWPTSPGLKSSVLMLDTTLPRPWGQTTVGLQVME
jgi:hypothetical protein